MKTNLRRAFTLIELLIVIAIIGILMALLFPAVGGAMEAAKRAKAKNDLVQIAVAVKAYLTEYGKLPILSSVASAGEHTAWFQGDSTGDKKNSMIIRVLAGEDADGLNPRKIVFLETRPAKGTGTNAKDGVTSDFMFYDPWGTPYAIKLDSNYDNRLEYYSEDPGKKENVTTTVITVSFGKNKKQQDITKSTDDNGRVDDLVSFQ
jgi:prepilin-type N-terminal cleavage/methylation domain-containing protein